MMSRLFNAIGFCLALFIALPALALTSGNSTSSRQACVGASTSSAASSNSASTLNCNVIVTNDWSSGYQINVVVKNTGAVAIDKWRVHLSIPDAHSISSLWGAVKTMFPQR